MVATVLAQGGLDPTMVIGGRVNALGSHARLGRSDLLVAEAIVTVLAAIGLWLWWMPTVPAAELPPYIRWITLAWDQEPLALTIGLVAWIIVTLCLLVGLRARVSAALAWALTLSFATWFMMSAIVVRLPQVGFQFSSMQLFWLAAMPGLAGGTLRIVNTFLIPMFGTRHVITVSTLLKVLPCIGLGFAVMNPETPFWIFMMLAFALGLGGGDFSSHMPSTSLFFPKRLQGTALGIQAGIGNFGVFVVQFLTPWIIGFAALVVFPFRMGEVVRPVLMHRAGKVSGWAATGTVGAERIDS